MPAYRSPAEAKIREAAVSKLRIARPSARIIHEINASYFGNRIDVLAVDKAEIIAVEIKSEKDKLDRLPNQIKAMRSVAHHTIAAIHEKFLIESVTNKGAAHREDAGVFYRGNVPDEACGAETWVFPQRKRAFGEAKHDPEAVWRIPRLKLETTLPESAIEILWRDELFWMCNKLGVSATRRSTMLQMIRGLRWRCTGEDLTLCICEALRSRKCCEADAPIEIDQEAA